MSLASEDHDQHDAIAQSEQETLMYDLAVQVRAAGSPEQLAADAYAAFGKCCTWGVMFDLAVQARAAGQPE